MKAQITIRQEIIPDYDADTSYLEQDMFQDRMEQYQNGHFGFVGVRAVAEIKVPHGQAWIVSKLSSPGLWGIEDDSGQEYFDEVFSEEKATLLEMLNSLHDYEIIQD